MRHAWKVVYTIKQVSGWSWDETTGASINQDTKSSWDDYVARHPEARPYCNRGWPYAHAFEIINPSPASGANVFVPTAPPLSTPLSAPLSATSSSQGNTQGGDEDGAGVAPHESQEVAAEGSDDDWEVSIFTIV
jgi:hypothetical protein